MLSKTEDYTNSGAVTFVTEGVRNFDATRPCVWHVLTVEARREKKVADRLLDMALAVFWPTYVVLKPRRGAPGRRVPVLKPAVPGYMFIPSIAKPVTKDEELPWGSIVDRIPGVRGYVKDHRNAPAIMRQRDVDTLRHIEGYLNLPPDEVIRGVPFKLGQQVRVVDGAFNDWEAKIVELARENRIGVEVDLLGRKVKVLVASSQIELI